MKEITQEQMERWLGSDFNIGDITQLLVEIANGLYPVEKFNEDVNSYDNSN